MKKKYAIGAAIITLFAGAGSFGADTPSPEMRKKMADAHQKMADCLRSDKPFSECKSEMMKTCHETMGKDGCPMMGEMHKHKHSD